MKKKFLMLLSALCFLTTLLSGCKPKEDAETVKTPILTVAADVNELAGEKVMEFLQSVPGYGTDFVAVSETFPWGGQDRDASLTRIKTEILAGKGPDLFICTSPAAENEEALFQFPQKAMKNHLLLPLDGYIENAQYMEWDKLMPKVMDAGRNEEGQQILPMSFSFGVRGVNTQLHTLTAELPMTWEESLVSDDPWVRYISSSGEICDTYGDIVNLEDDTLRITEEDIIRWNDQTNKNRQDVSAGKIPEFSDAKNDPDLMVNLNIGTFSMQWEKDPLGGDNEYWLAPVYNTEGGITASIDAFAAINRNTKYPDQSFRILDYMLSYNAQRGVLFANLFGMPVHMDVGMDGSSGLGWSMNDWNKEQYLSLLDQINAVKFYTPIDRELHYIFADYDKTGDFEGSVHKHYMTMQMMLAES